MYQEIETQKDLKTVLKQEDRIENKAFQNLNLKAFKEEIKHKKFVNCIFLGCKMSKSLAKKLTSDNLIFPIIDVPFNPFVNKLYTKETLFNNYEPGNPDSYNASLDMKVYKHYLEQGKIADDIKETLARRLHDHAITDALYDFIATYDERQIVAIMGGHNLARNNTNYYKVAQISKSLTEQGYLMISGGGPGAMEATHLGAWFAGRDEDDLLKAISILADAPTYKDTYWLDKSFEVLKLFPQSDYLSLGVPTWLYGHEPPTPFATHIAKYFANSVREDGLLTIAKGGVIFSPGNAGTIQEIFQDATQNHYVSFGYASPMVFFNSDYWTYKKPIYPLLESMMQNGEYKNLILSKYDTVQGVVAEIKQFSVQNKADY